MGLEAVTSEMLNEYRTRLHVNASEYTHVMTSAMWVSIARRKSSHNSAEGLPATRDGSRRRGRRENVKDQLARFHLTPHGGKKACFQNLTAKGCSGGANTCGKDGFCHIVPKKSDIPVDALIALETHFGSSRPDLN
jgi:hypothetical protein